MRLLPAVGHLPRQSRLPEWHQRGACASVAKHPRRQRRGCRQLTHLAHRRTSATSTARPATATAARTSALLLHACIGERATLLVAYPCLVCSGEMDGCGLRYPFTGQEVCECEDGYVHLLPSNCRAQPTHVFRTPIPLICDMVPISATLATTATRLPALCAPPAARATCARRAASLTARAHARPALWTSAIA